MKKGNQIQTQLEILKATDVETHLLAVIGRTPTVSIHLQALVDEISVNDIHVIRAISQLDKPKIGEVVAEIELTQGAVSKIIKRLERFSLIEKYHLANNKKDTYLQLTDDGREVFELHQEYHQKLHQKLNQLADKYSSAEQAIILQFLTEYNQIHGE